VQLSITLANSIWFINHGHADVIYDLKWINDNLASSLGIQLDQISESFFIQLESLRNMIINILNEKNILKHLEQLNQTMALANYHNRVYTKDGEPIVEQISFSENKNQLLSAIAMDIVQLYMTDKLTHIKICSNNECQFFYIDYSKNNSKKYCSSKCSTLIKVRRHRSKI